MKRLSTEEFSGSLEELRAGVQDPEAGFWGPRSWTWRVNGELILYMAGPRALLLQAAHPLVAQGVVEHSQFRTDPLGRAIRTHTAMYSLMFGTTHEASRTAERLYAIHRRIRGLVDEDVGRFKKGDPYNALDPVLLRWVWATLTDSAVRTYRQFVREMSGRRTRA